MKSINRFPNANVVSVDILLYFLAE